MMFISDVHGQIDDYVGILERENPDKSIQLGDMGFDYRLLDNVDSDRHKVVGGNHDNMDELPKYSHYLGDFGIWEGVFFVRGAKTIDRPGRLDRVQWWPEEELNHLQTQEVIKLYTQEKPRVVASHTCPYIIKERILYRRIESSHTEALLDILLDIHQPEFWIFAHFHRNWMCKYRNTTFHCVDILNTLIVDDI